jgi:hypothetical protein
LALGKEDLLLRVALTLEVRINVSSAIKLVSLGIIIVPSLNIEKIAGPELLLSISNIAGGRFFKVSIAGRCIEHQEQETVHLILSSKYCFLKASDINAAKNFLASGSVLLE